MKRLLLATLLLTSIATAQETGYIKRGQSGIVHYQRTYSDFTSPPQWTIIYVNRKQQQMVFATSLQPNGWNVKRYGTYCKIFVPRGSHINHPFFNHYLVRAKLPGTRAGYGEARFFVE